MQSGKTLMLDFHMSNWLLTWTPLPYLLKCLSLYFVSSNSQFYEVIRLSFHQLCIDLWKHTLLKLCCETESVWRIWQKLPFIRKTMGHITFDDLHNRMPHVITQCVSKACSGWWVTCGIYSETVWLVIKNKRAWSQQDTRVWHHNKHEGLIFIAVPSLMTTSAALDSYTFLL